MVSSFSDLAEVFGGGGGICNIHLGLFYFVGPTYCYIVFLSIML